MGGNKFLCSRIHLPVKNIRILPDSPRFGGTGGHISNGLGVDVVVAVLRWLLSWVSLVTTTWAPKSTLSAPALFREWEVVGFMMEIPLGMLLFCTSMFHLNWATSNSKTVATINLKKLAIVNALMTPLALLERLCIEVFNVAGVLRACWSKCSWLEGCLCKVAFMVVYNPVGLGPAFGTDRVRKTWDDVSRG